MTAPMRWFLQPDLNWLNQVNTTNLRSVNAVRGFIYTGVVWGFVYVATSYVGMRSIWLCRPDTKELACSSLLLAAERALSFAQATLDSWMLLVAAMGGFALGGAIGKRLTDTTHQERVTLAKAEVEKAKAEGEKAKAEQAKIQETKERPAVVPTQQINMVQGEGDTQ